MCLENIHTGKKGEGKGNNIKLNCFFIRFVALKKTVFIKSQTLSSFFIGYMRAAGKASLMTHFASGGHLL